MRDTRVQVPCNRPATPFLLAIPAQPPPRPQATHAQSRITHHASRSQPPPRPQAAHSLHPITPRSCAVRRGLDLRTFERTGNPFAGPTGPHKAGNGSLMRLAPVPMFYFKSPREAIERAGESSRTTHGAQTAVDACRCFAGLLVGALGGVDKDITAFSLGLWVACGWLVGGLWVACGSHEGRMKVASGWLVGRNPFPTTWLEGGLWVALPGFDSWPSGLGVGEGPIRTTTNESRLVETFSIPGVSRPASSRPGFLCRNSAVAAGAHYK